MMSIYKCCVAPPADVSCVLLRVGLEQIDLKSSVLVVGWPSDTPVFDAEVLYAVLVSSP